jgi:acyl-coenzyme A synthetase/AMP-(fatty) acid ligase
MILPATLKGVDYIEAAKRLGIIYACVPASLPAQSLADRLEDTGAKVLFIEGQSGLALGNEVVSNFYSVSKILDWSRDSRELRLALAGHVAVSSAFL